MKILHIIPSMNSGGAETMLFKLIKNKQAPEIEYEILTLRNPGFYSKDLEDINIKVVQFNFRNFPEIISMFKRADIIQSWMYHSDTLNFLIGKLIFRKKVVFNIRRSHIGKNMKDTTKFLLKVNSYLASFTERVISCSHSGVREHLKYNYPQNKFLVIPNGFELEKFLYSDKEADLNEIKLINVARWEPLKDHYTLLKSCEKLKQRGYNFKLSLIGKGIDKNNKELMHFINSMKLNKNVELLGEQKDVYNHLTKSDIYLSSSISEGFPNVIGEAMSTGLITIATDAGDSKDIINNENLIVPIKDPDSLCQKIIEIINKDKSELLSLKRFLRKEIEQKYSIESIVSQYERLYRDIYTEDRKGRRTY